ncbi:UNKNOWN [Stylonychia lemnae]|uniref:Uncharacterized protein n=1 Tax=Stylonychia lemnae TaxID=5949 RepID=A0A077ZYA2_STYLE|nr:UNKNOWN [Stylonychia lemnae]|eukprot:CDW74617.1 UNKNOWN [Stylonychia lemnae]
MKSLAINDSYMRSDTRTHFDIGGVMNLDQEISEGTKRKAEALLRLKQKNEEKMKKVEIVKSIKELEEEEKKEKYQLELSKSNSKVNLSLDLQRIQKQNRLEQLKKKEEEKKYKQEEMTAREQQRQASLLRKINQDSHRADMINEYKQRQLSLKSELDQYKQNQQQEKLQIIQKLQEEQKLQLLQKHQQKKKQAEDFVQQKKHVINAKQIMVKDFQEKKQLIMMKLQELKKSGKGIEEIYKYTNDIIFEEEDEEEQMLNETQRNRDEIIRNLNTEQLNQEVARLEQSQDYGSGLSEQKIKKSGSKSLIYKTPIQNSIQDIENANFQVDFESNSVSGTTHQDQRSMSLDHNQELNNINGNLQGNQGRTYSDHNKNNNNKSNLDQKYNLLAAKNKRYQSTNLIQSNQSRNNRYGNASSNLRLGDVNPSKSQDPYKPDNYISNMFSQKFTTQTVTQRNTKRNILSNNSNYDAYQVYTGGQNNANSRSRMTDLSYSLYVPSNVNQSQQYIKGQLGDILGTQNKNLPRKQIQMPNQSFEILKKPMNSNIQKLVPINSMNIKQDDVNTSYNSASIINRLAHSNNENHFLIELVRKRQKEEILSVIRDEERKERDRLEKLKDPQFQEQKNELETQFNVERRLAQQRIESTIKRHEEQIGELQMEQRLATQREIQQLQSIQIKPTFTQQQQTPLNQIRINSKQSQERKGELNSDLIGNRIFI